MSWMGGVAWFGGVGWVMENTGGWGGVGCNHVGYVEHLVIIFWGRGGGL